MTFQFGIPVLDEITGVVKTYEFAAAGLMGPLPDLPGPTGLLPIATAVGIAAVARWMWFGQGDQLERFDQVKRRHAELMAVAAKLHEASQLIRLFNGTSTQYRALNQHFADVMAATGRLNSQVDRAEFEISGWHFHKARRALGLLERNLRDLEREMTTLQDGLKGLNDDNQECTRCLSRVKSQRDDLLKQAKRREVGWADDVCGALLGLEEAIARTESLHAAGDLVLALQHCHDVSQSLAAHRKAIEGRALTLRWLVTVPEQTRRLAAEKKRLEEIGFRGLPDVPADDMKERAQRAVDQFYQGDLEAVMAEQQRLRRDLEALRQGLTGREEIWWANNRDIKALRTELQTLEAQLAAVRPVGCVDRYPARLWRPAERQEADVRAVLARLWESLAAAEADNALATQHFDRARDRLRQAVTLRSIAREEMTRTADLWHMPTREEARLRSLLMSLLGEAGAAHAQARLLGMSQDPTVEALLHAARNALESRPCALDEARQTLESATHALERYRGRMAELESRMEGHTTRRQPAVVFLREHPEDAHHPSNWRR
jgi:septation ring formation regulator EzrA